jgi:DNA-binding transcriptional ArsR family regulator
MELRALRRGGAVFGSGENFALDIFRYRNILLRMPRAATTADVFNAIAEQRRREIIDVLSAGREHAVGELVLKLGISQPAVSKHLGVLRKVGLVNVNRQGQQRLYSLNAQPLKSVYDWAKTYERFWDEQLDAIKAAAERKARERANQNQPAKRPKP